MQNPINDLSDVTQLLYEITSAYEKEIARLTNKNRQLERILSVGVVFKNMRRFKKATVNTQKYAENKLKEYIIRLGLKEYIKNSTVYKFYKRKR